MNKPQNNIEEQLIKYYDGKLTGAEYEEIKLWITASKENHQQARRIYSILLAMDVQQIHKKIDTEKALEKIRGKKILQKRKISWQEWLQRAAAILFLPLIGLLVWQQNELQINKHEAAMLEVHTTPGMTTRLKLPDGTFVCLNSESTLSYPSKFTGETRSVHLSGEGYFEVTKDKSHRFIVNTPNHSAIEVYGTCFNIEAYPESPNITTTLTEGKIGFRYKKGKTIKQVLLNPGQKLIYNASNQDLSCYQTSGTSELSWKDGKVIFENTPLTEALHMLSKRFNVDFHVKKTELNNNHFTGTFTTQRLEEILKYFEISSHIRWRYLNTPNINQEKMQIEIY